MQTSVKAVFTRRTRKDFTTELTSVDPRPLHRVNQLGLVVQKPTIHQCELSGENPTSRSQKLNAISMLGWQYFAERQSLFSGVFLS